MYDVLGFKRLEKKNPDLQSRHTQNAFAFPSAFLEIPVGYAYLALTCKSVLLTPTVLGLRA